MSTQRNGLHCCIGLRDLDWEDERFAVYSYRSGEELEWSLHRFGLLQPPWVWNRRDGKAVIVDGFKRLRRLYQAGEETVIGLVFPPTAGEARLWLRRIAAKLCGPPLNTAEKAQIVARLTQLDCSEADRVELLRLLQVAPRAEVIAQWSCLAGSDPALLGAAATEQICDRAALSLPEWGESSRRQALALLQELRCSASIQVQILEQISEIALAGGRTRSSVLQDVELREILAHPDWNHRQKTQAVRELLTRRRLPRLKRREEQFARDLAAAALPPAVKLVPPAAFEGMRWQLQITFSHPEELHPLLERVGNFAASQVLPQLLYGSVADVENNS